MGDFTRWTGRDRCVPGTSVASVEEAGGAESCRVQPTCPEASRATQQPHLGVSVKRPALVGDSDDAVLIGAGYRAQIRHVLCREPLLLADPRLGMTDPLSGLEVEFARVDVVGAIAVGAVDYPDIAVLLRRDGAADEVFLRHGDGERLAPLAGAVIAHEELVAKPRRVEVLEVGGLFLQRRGLDAAALLLQRVGDVRHP